MPTRSEAFPAVNRFSDADPSVYLNPHLPFGSANIPTEGFNFELVAPNADAPAGAKVQIDLHWTRD